MARLPEPGGDAGNWGEILNDFLRQEHNEDGTFKRPGIPQTEADERYVQAPEHAGTPGQVLTKSGADATATVWSEPAGAGTVEAENTLDVAGGFLTRDGKITWLTTKQDGSPTDYAKQKLSEAGVGIVSDGQEIEKQLRVAGYELTTLQAGPEHLLSLGGVTSWAQTADAPVQTTWETYDGSGVVVHPSVLYFKDGFNDYQWWAAATPYPGGNDDLENPSIFVSANGTDWAPPPGVTNPLVPDPDPLDPNNYNADTHLTQHPDGTLYIFFRGGATPQGLYVITSGDGVAWTAPELSRDLTDNIYANELSPSVWYDRDSAQWIMLSVRWPATQTGYTEHAILRSTAPTAYGPWSEPIIVRCGDAFDPAGTPAPWHMYAWPQGREVWALVSMATSRGGGGWIRLAKSMDAGVTFTFSTAQFGHSNGYRCSAVPRMDANGQYLDLFIGGAQPNWGVKRYVARPGGGS